jgi:hypothetical protein
MSDKAGEMSKDVACFLVHLKTLSQTKLHAAVLVKLIVSVSQEIRPLLHNPNVHKILSLDAVLRLLNPV